MAGWLIEKMEGYRDRLALATPEAVYTYGQLLDRIASWQSRLATLPAGSVIGLEGDYSLDAIAAFVASLQARHIVVPLSPDSRTHHDAYRDIASLEYRIALDRPSGGEGPERTARRADHPLYNVLRERRHPGLVLFSSGSTGQPKAALHDLDTLLEKFQTPRQTLRMLVFLLLDHIGGVNTLFYGLSNGGAVVLAKDRSARSVCDAIDTHRVELLPTSPTFLNLLLLSGELRDRDLSSLKLITYGTEPMPASTLENACRAFPQARFQQTYGLTELGILRSQSRDSNSLWIRIGGEGFEWKVVDGRLWIRARSAMLGYLNAPSPFDDEGFFDTGDLVELDGEWVRFLGRKSEVINVGGSKVHPAEVESVLLDMDNVVDVMVAGEAHALTGQIVVATVRLVAPEPLGAFKLRMRQFCATRLAPFQVPAKVHLTDRPLHSSRFKRVRRLEPSSASP